MPSDSVFSVSVSNAVRFAFREFYRHPLMPLPVITQYHPTIEKFFVGHPRPVVLNGDDIPFRFGQMNLYFRRARIPTVCDGLRQSIVGIGHNSFIGAI